MAPRKKPAEVEETTTEITDNGTQPVETFNFEPVTDELFSQLQVWGNLTISTINRIKEKYPGWADMLETVNDIILSAVKENKQ